MKTIHYLAVVMISLRLFSSSTWAQDLPAFMTPDPNTPSPIEVYDTVFIEEMTWMEVRNALRAGKTTVIIATGGVEQNGPYVATGKHNYTLLATTDAIARKLGDALVAPIVPFVPEGRIDPPSGHMRYPGTISVKPETFQRLLTDIASSFKAHGFKHIILIGDSRGNQVGMQAVADTLSIEWPTDSTSIHYISEYYNAHPVLPQNKWLETQGIHEVDEGLHDNFVSSAILMTVDPNLVRMQQRIKANKFSINGVNLAPSERTIEIGKRAVEYLTEKTVVAIQKAIGK